MTTYIESIVDLDATIEEADALAQTVVSELCKRGIILSTPQTHEFLENGPRYARGPNVLDAAEAFNVCFPCGMEVSIGRNVYDTGELGFEVICPRCNHPHGKEDVDWATSVGEWFDSGNIRLLPCSKCSASSPFVEWFHPEFGFGNLAFQFIEWFLKPEFVHHIADLLQHRITWVKAQY